MKALVALALAAALGGVVTWMALESGEVAILHTTTEGGWPRRAKVWVADADGLTWMEAGSPARPWYRDLLARPRVKLERRGVVAFYDAEPRAAEADAVYARSLMEKKYGWAARWVGLFREPSETVAIRLHPR